MITKILIMKKRSRRIKVREGDVMMVAEVGLIQWLAMGQGVPAASRSHKRQRSRFSVGPPAKMQAS